MFRPLIRKLKDELVVLAWRRSGAALGAEVQFFGATPRLKLEGPMVVGSGCTFLGSETRSVFRVSEGGRLDIGDRVFFNGGLQVQASLSVTIGDGCLIGDDVVIQDTSFHEVDEGGAVKVAPVRIGDNVWIARRAIILPGVAIGDHSVVGAGSIVTRNVPPMTVVAGSPARFVRKVEASETFRR